MHKQTEEVRITVFTPAYNRGYIIENLYRSLQRQTYRDFEWLVVDDGSTDDTEQKFAAFLTDENDFPIRYIKTSNGGKHRTVNRGVQEAKGTLFFIVDSDDYVADDALEWIDKVEKTIPQDRKKQFCGVCGLKAYDLENMIGTSFSEEFLDITSLERNAYGISGDKAEVFYTDVLRRYPFPTFEGEKFITECVVWNRIAEDGLKLRFYNHISILCNYLEDGLTANGHSLFLRNPRGYAFYLNQSSRYGILTGVEKCNSYIGLYEELRGKNSFLEISNIFQTNPMKLRMKLFVMRIYRRLFEGREKNDS